MAVPPADTQRRNHGGAGRIIGVSTLAGVVAAGMLLPVVGGVAAGVKTFSSDFDALPSELTSQALPQRTYIEAANGERIATLYTQNRIVVPLDQISPHVRNAVVAIEDVRFREHSGVDVRGAMRALAANSTAGEVQQGSSTITMQYVRNILISNAKTKEEIESARTRSLGRKIQEMRYAIAIEKKLTKDQILAGYLNVAYFGAGAHGVEAAAQRYFGTSASKLSLSQAATLAGIVQQPVGYDPTRNPQAATSRRNVVLDKMVQAGSITAAEARAAQAIPMKKLLNPKSEGNGCAESKYPFYCEFVVHQIENDRRYGPTPEARVALLQRGGLVIKTALDTSTQDYATKVANEYIPKDDPSKKATAIAMVDPVNGEVRTLAQNRDWGLKGKGKTTYNYAVDAKDGGTIGMQAGSTFKLFTLLAAMEDNQDPTEYISAPASKLFSAGDWGCKDGRFGQFSVSNSTSSGTMNMFQATAYSVNTYFVELQRRVGLCKTVSVAERMGMTMASGKPLPRYPSFTLGSLEISPLSLASAYATTANHGIYCRPHAVRAVTDLAGRRLFSDSGDCKRVVSRESADAVAAILTGVIDGNIPGRTGQKMAIGREAAGKTGTTDSNAAVWFAGFTPELATAVWVGDPRGGFKYPMRDVTINGRYYSKVYGSYLPGPIWRDVMSYALQDTPEASFDLEPKFDIRTARQGGGVAPRPYSYGYDSYDYLRPEPTPSGQRGRNDLFADPGLPSPAPQR